MAVADVRSFICSPSLVSPLGTENHLLRYFTVGPWHAQGFRGWRSSKCDHFVNLFKRDIKVFLVTVIIMDVVVKKDDKQLALLSCYRNTGNPLSLFS